VRDGIVQAAIDSHGGEDVCLIWRAFAAFGLGLDAAGGGPWNLEVSNGFQVPAACRCAALDPPTGLEARALGGGRVELRWNTSPGAGGYNVYRARTSCAGDETLERVAQAHAGRRWVDAEGASGVFSYRVRAVDSDGDCESLPGSCAEIPSFDLRPAGQGLGVCTPGAAELLIETESVRGFDEPIALSATTPPGVAAGFAPNPVRPGDASRLRVVAGTPAPTGRHDVGLVATAASPKQSRELLLRLDVYDSAPTAPHLLSPADLATDTALTPALRWSEVDQAATYTVEIATDAGFADLVYEDTVALASAAVARKLDRDTTYWWRARAGNSCGTSASSQVFSFRTTAIDILLVDDDDDRPNVRYSYSSALDGLGHSYDIWNTRQSADEPAAEDLEPYDVVIWFSGEEYGGVRNPQAGPTPASESALAAFLSHPGTCLAIISQDYLWDMGGRYHDEPTPFMGTYLGIAAGESDVGHTSVAGHGPFAGFGPVELVFPFRNFSDSLSPRPGARLAFSGETEDGIFDAAVSKQGPGWRTSYWGFPLEAVPAAADRQRLLELLLEDCRRTGLIFGDGFESGGLGAWLVGSG
jgi:hypothetical protein